VLERGDGWYRNPPLPKSILLRVAGPLKSQDLTSGSIVQHMCHLAVPSSIGLFFQTMYNVVDSVYAGYISTLALAALGLSFPVFLVIIATSGGLSRGASALISNAIGAGDSDRQRTYATQALSVAIVISVLLTAAGFLLAEPLFRLMGASGEYLQVALAYMIPVFSGAVFFVLINLCNAILVASGDSKTFGLVLVVGFFANLVLDPWFLYGGWGVPAMGVAGIAWATVVIQGAGSLVLLATIVKRKLLVVEAWTDLLPNLKIYREIARQAVPASFNIMQVAISFFVITYFLKTYGEANVAAFGVTTRIEQIGLLPTMGLSAAIMALVGQNNGAKLFGRIRLTMKLAIIAGQVLNGAAAIIMFFFARQLMQIFTNDEEVIRLGVNCLYVIAPIQWSYVLTAAHLNMLQAMKRPMYGFYEAMFRKVILPAPLFWLFVSYWAMPVEWIWYSVAVTNVLMTIVTVIIGQRVLASLPRDVA